MNNLPLFMLIGIAIIFALYFAHSKLKMTTPRSRFVVLALFGLGATPFAYIGVWVFADQSPAFGLESLAAFGAAMWVVMALYSVVLALALWPSQKERKDTAPSQ